MTFTRSSPSPPPSLPNSSGASQEHAARPRCAASSRVDATNVGLRAVQAFARHRLDHVPFVGCPRSVVLAASCAVSTSTQPSSQHAMPT